MKSVIPKLFLLLLTGCWGQILYPIDLLGPQEQEMVRQLEEFDQQLANSLPFLPTLQQDRLGYHSGYKEVSTDEVSDSWETPKWTLLLRAPDQQQFHLIDSALFPALAGKGGKLESYGFPKRFRVMGVRAESRVELFRWNQEWNSRMFPVFFPVNEGHVNGVAWDALHLEVFEGIVEDGLESFALGEWMVFGRKDDGRIDNRARWMPVTSNQWNFVQKPYWAKPYLTDNRVGHGLPLGKQTKQDTDLLLQFDRRPADGIHLYYEIQRPQTVGRVRILPGQHPIKRATTVIGFPKDITFSYTKEMILDSPLDAQYEQLIPREGASQIEVRPVGNPYIAVLLSPRASILKISFRELPIYEGKHTLAIGEIEILHDGSYIGRLVGCEGLSPEQEAKLSRLSDGYANERNILPRREWSKGLADRGVLESDRIQLSADLDALRADKRGVLLAAAWVVLLGLLISMLVWLTAVKVKAKRAESRLREELASNLHDDVGALLGCSMLAAKKLETQVNDPKQQIEVARVIDATQKATGAIRDIVWIYDREQESLEDLVHRIREYAQQFSNYYSVQITSENVENAAQLRIRAACRRDVYSFVKECLNNVQKHAKASAVHIRIKLISGRMRIEVEDDGKGFDVDGRSEDQRRRNFGLRAMRRRAKNLGGSLEIESQSGQGTVITLVFVLRKVLR